MQNTWCLLLEQQSKPTYYLQFKAGLINLSTFARTCFVVPNGITPGSSVLQKTLLQEQFSNKTPINFENRRKQFFLLLPFLITYNPRFMQEHLITFYQKILRSMKLIEN